MNGDRPIEAQAIGSLHARLSSEAEAGGYRLNPDREFTRGLVEGLLVNEQRYGYRACPCRLATGERVRDLDIICPCDYRDEDLVDWGACYCGLYVSDEIAKGKRLLQSIPERRPAREGAAEPRIERAQGLRADPLSLPVWRCRVCGYLCAREKPPGICPICKATADRFERFL
jgi:ferredoxin-thioredoxin reductase catalytic chain